MTASHHTRAIQPSETASPGRGARIAQRSAVSMTADHDLEARFRISFWDALVVQAAQASGAEILYSEDLSDEQAYGAVLVINPLRAGV